MAARKDSLKKPVEVYRVRYVSVSVYGLVAGKPDFRSCYLFQVIMGVKN